MVRKNYDGVYWSHDTGRFFHRYDNSWFEVLGNGKLEPLQGSVVSGGSGDLELFVPYGVGAVKHDVVRVGSSRRDIVTSCLKDFHL